MKNKEAERNNLAIIGASGTGKTTLAVGLYATSTDAFTVSPIGDATRKYLEVRKTSIEEGFWPAATNESAKFDIWLRLHAAGKQTDIVFCEYMGERMERPDYIDTIIGVPRSAMILFNPGMPGLSKPETRNKMLGNLKKIAQHLKDNKCIAVAFVVTASDRLASDLKAFKEDFEACASEVTNHLTNLGLDWKRFDVTVSGQLDDQNKPKLARGDDNTTHEPFLWLLKRIRDFNLRKRLVSTVAIVAILLGIAGVLFGGIVVHSRNLLDGAERNLANATNVLNEAFSVSNQANVRTTAEFFKTNKFDKIMAILPSDKARKQTLLDLSKEQKDLWDVRLLRMEFDAAKTNLATAHKRLDVKPEWFEKFENRLKASHPESNCAGTERDALVDEWNKSRIEMGIACQTAHFKDAVEKEKKNLAAAKDADIAGLVDGPLHKSKGLLAVDKTNSLVTNREDLCISLGLISARTNAIARYVDYMIGKPEDENPPADIVTLRQQISKALKTVLTIEEFGKLPDMIKSRHSFARSAWEGHWFPEQEKKHLNELRAAAVAPAVALMGSLSFLESIDNKFASIHEDRRSAAKRSITSERAAAIGRYLDEKTNWKPEDEDPPGDTSVLQQQARQELKSALTEEEFKSLEDTLAKRSGDARKAWDAFHFPRKVSELESALKSAGANPSRPLADSLAFLGVMTNNYPTIPRVEFVKAQNSICDARRAAIVAYEDSIIKKWDVNGSNPPEFDVKKIRDAILTQAAVTDDEYKAFEENMNARFDTAKQVWNTNQKKRVDDFSVEVNIQTMLTKYGEFCDECPNNPYLDDLAAKVDQTLCRYFRDFICGYESTFFGNQQTGTIRIGDDKIPSERMVEIQRSYCDFVAICRKFDGPGLANTAILKKPSGRFARLCLDRGKMHAEENRGIYATFQQTLRIRKIETLFSLDDFDSTYLGLDLAVSVMSRRWNFEARQWEIIRDSEIFDMKNATNSGFSGRIPKSDVGAWIELWKGDFELPYNPYTLPSIHFICEDRTETGRAIFDVREKFGRWLDIYDPSQTFQIHVFLKHTGWGNTSTKGLLQVRVTGERLGVNYRDLARESGIVK